jgi:uncharacterized membrane protein
MSSAGLAASGDAGMTDGGETSVTAHETIDERLLNRLIFFTDAVFAIVLTLMVLDLKPPPFDSPLGKPQNMQGFASHFVALALSFAVISNFWLAHLATTRKMRRFDWPSAVANLVFLFPVCLLPFATAWWGRDPTSPFPWGVYCGTMVATSLANVALVLVVSRGGGRLMGGVTGRERLYRAARAASPGLAFALGIVLMAAGLLRAAQFCWVLIPVLVWGLDRTLKPIPDGPAAV